MGSNAVPVWTTAPLQYSLIAVKVIALDKVSFTDVENRKTVC